jgi:hypothetical protein
MDVIDESNFSSFDEKKTMLLVRNASAYETQKVAEMVGFTPAQIVQQPMDDNFLDINFTVVVGEDFPGILEPDRVEK